MAGAAGAGALHGLAFGQPDDRGLIHEDPTKEQLEARLDEAARSKWIACKYGMIGDGDSIEEKFRVAKDAGFSGVELPSPAGLDFDAAREAAEKVGIEIPGVVDSVHWGKPLSHPDESVRAEGRAGLERAILDCKTAGGDTVLLVPAVVNDGVTYLEAWDRSIREIRRVMPVAQGHQITIAIEIRDAHRRR